MTDETGGASLRNMPLRDFADRFFDLTGDMLAVLDQRGVVVHANARFVEICGVQLDEITGRKLSEVMAPASPGRLADAIARLRAGEPIVHLELAAAIRGTKVSLDARLHADADNRVVYFVARDVSENRRLAEQILGRAPKDQLATLNNRNGFQDALDLERRMADSMGVVILRIDDIEAITEEHGQQVRDELLQAAVSRMRRNLRDTDLVARFGTNEFAILISGRDVIASAERLGAQLAETMKRAFGVKGIRIDVIASVGVSTTRTPAVDGADLVARATVAAAEARQTGQTACVVHGSDVPAALESNDTSLMTEALNKPDQLSVHVEGIFGAEQRGAMGVEVLLVLKRPAFERLSKAAEGQSDDPIAAINETLAVESVDTVGPWIAAHPGRRLCVNVSHDMVGSTSLYDVIAKAANRNGIDPRQIVCEISERTLDDPSVNASRVVRDIRHHGFLVAIDSFGNELASLGILHDLDIAYIKLDPMLVTDMFTSDYHTALIRSAVEVGRTMGVSVVATGITTSEQLEAVRRLGCSYVQGPYVHPHEPLATFAAKVLSAVPGSRGTDASA